MVTKKKLVPVLFEPPFISELRISFQDTHEVLHRLQASAVPFDTSCA